MLDATGCVAKKSISVKVQLVYADEDKEGVRDQKILTFPDDFQPRVSQGRLLVKVRIEEVCRRHQNRLFALKIVPDVAEDPLSAEVAELISCPINVLSKIPPKQKKALQEAQASKSSASLVKLSSIGSLVGPHGYNVIGHDHAGLYEGNLPPPAALKAALMPVHSNSSDGPPVAKALSNVLEYVSPLALYGAPL
jgi:hypothetical protein